MEGDFNGRTIPNRQVPQHKTKEIYIQFREMKSYMLRFHMLRGNSYINSWPHKVYYTTEEAPRSTPSLCFAFQVWRLCWVAHRALLLSSFLRTSKHDKNIQLNAYKTLWKMPTRQLCAYVHSLIGYDKISKTWLIAVRVITPFFDNQSYLSFSCT